MKFPNPPLIEAILDIRVKIPDESNKNDLAAFQDAFKEEFPIFQYARNLEVKGEINLDDSRDEITGGVHLSSQSEGHIFRSSDGKKVVKVTLNGFTFSWLKPYESWEKFYGKADQLWQHYVDIISPTEVSRVALRYINKIKLPQQETIELRDYIGVTPEIPDNFPAKLIDYFMRLVVIHPDYSPSKGIITQMITREAENGIILEPEEVVHSIIFDIDVFQEVSIFPENEVEIKRIFEENLRKFKNEIFFKSLTQKTQELFQ